MKLYIQVKFQRAIDAAMAALRYVKSPFTPIAYYAFASFRITNFIPYEARGSKKRNQINFVRFKVNCNAYNLIIISKFDTIFVNRIFC